MGLAKAATIPMYGLLAKGWQRGFPKKKIEIFLPLPHTASVLATFIWQFVK
jgi:hypothetical protein